MLGILNLEKSPQNQHFTTPKCFLGNFTHLTHFSLKLANLQVKIKKCVNFQTNFLTPPTPGNDLHWTQVQIFLFDFDLKVIIERKTNAGARSYARKARKAKTARNARNLRNVAQGQRDPYKQGIYYPYFFVVIFQVHARCCLPPKITLLSTGTRNVTIWIWIWIMSP